MELISVTILNPDGTKNGTFGFLPRRNYEEATKKDSRKDTRNLSGRTEEAGDTLSGHGSAHFYTGVPPVSALCEGEALTTRGAGNFVRAEINRKGASSAVRSCDYCGCGRLPAMSAHSRQGPRRAHLHVEHLYRSAHFSVT